MDIMGYVKTNVPAISPTDLATKARAILRDFKLRILPVVEDEKLVGIITRISILTITSSKSNLLVRDIMEEPKIVLKPSFSLKKAVREMLKVDVWYAPVVSEDNKFIGIFGLENVIKKFYNEDIPVNNKPIEEFMTTDVVTVSSDDEVSVILHKMLKYRFSGLPVVDDRRRVVGIVTEYDILKFGMSRILLESERSKGYRRVRAREIMSTAVYKVIPNTPLRDAAKIMVEKDIGRVVVVNEKNELIGIVDREDVVRAYMKYM